MKQFIRELGKRRSIMNLRMNRAFSLALLAGALSIGASLANAQGNYKGTFNLPVETHWGLAVLAPGQYTVSIDPVYMPSVIQIRGEGHVAAVLAGPVTGMPTSERGRLKLVNVNGTYVVKQFDAGLVGKSFAFATPKALRNRENRSVASTETTVDVFGSR
jgi:hypothetical protein